jgi:hypothetical protein
MICIPLIPIDHIAIGAARDALAVQVHIDVKHVEFGEVPPRIGRAILGQQLWGLTHTYFLLRY